MTAVELAQLWQAWLELLRADGWQIHPTGPIATSEALGNAIQATEAVLEEYRQDVAAALDIQAKSSAGHAEKDET